ncbi:MAG TPA: hypothetical protein VFS10_06840, partial [Pyrinomonadaceae bacterium]|nr:hypothetical protein [Pyrinomonadaceae bacterium]
RNHTIRIVERIATGEDAGRYQLESEDDNHRWTIDAENLARIFGDSTKRKCACLPIGDAAALEAASAVAATRVPEAAPAEAEQSAEPPDTAESHPATADAAEVAQGEPDGEAGSPSAEEKAQRPRRRRAEAAPTDAAPPATGVIFHEDDRQGALF